MSAPVDVLRNVPLFADLDDDDLAGLANQMKERRFSEGGVGFFVMADGNATVSVGAEAKATLGPGDYFGEIALIDEGTRSATITAATDVVAYGITSWEFKPFVEDHPQVAWALLKTLAQRLRAAQAQD
jgi:CRP/FNR family cyclic AMP-dependent transcriptional regulator